jgi:sulfur carrier protein
VIIELNGKRAELPEGASVAQAVAAAGADGERRGVAVAVEGEVVPRGEWDATSLSEGQAVEVVRAIQGG